MTPSNKRSWISYKSTVSWIIVSIIFLAGFLSVVQNVNADSLQVSGPEIDCERQDGTISDTPCQAGMTVVFGVSVAYGGNPFADAQVSVSVTTPNGAMVAAANSACAIPTPGDYCFRYTLSPSAQAGVYAVNVRAKAQFCAGSCPDPGTSQTTFSVVPAGTTTTTAGSQTDWAVTSVSLSPSAPNVGDQVTLSAVITAVSSTGSFPQSVEVGCQIDTEICGSGTISYPGPVGVPFTVTSQTPWIATPGRHTLTWGIVKTDPNPSNNVDFLTFTVGQGPQQQFDFSISASPSTQTINPGGSTTYAVTVNLLSGSPQSVAMSLIGAPGGVSGSFNPTSGTPSFTSTLTVSATTSVSPGSYMLTVTGSGGGVQHTTTVSLTVSQAPDFQVNVSPSSQTVLQGQTVSYAVNVVGLNGFNSQVSLAVSSLPSGTSGVFSVPSANPNFASTLTITLPTSIPTGSFMLTITGNGGGITHVANVLLTVNQSTQTMSTTETTTPVGSSITDIIQQNPLIVLVVIVLILLAVFALRRRPSEPTPVAQPSANVIYCGKCGNQNATTNQFCRKCGAKLG